MQHINGAVGVSWPQMWFGYVDLERSLDLGRGVAGVPLIAIPYNSWLELRRRLADILVVASRRGSC